MGANLITPEYEYQEKHHLFFGKPEEERRTNRRECAYPYACDICQPAHRVYNGLPHRCSQMGHRQTACKAGLHQQAEAERIRNQHRPAALLYGNTEHLQEEFEVQGTMPTTAQVKEAFNSLHSEKREEEQQKPLTFAPMEVFGEFIKECGTQNGWSDATYEKFAAVRKHLEKFDKELTFEALDEPKLTSYVNFLKDVEGLRNTSTMKQIAYLKWFLRWCTKKGYCMNNAYENFNPKLKSVQKKVIFLTWEELNKLKDYKIPPTKQYLERVRDVFLFCCFSGLRYSDVYNLKRSDIRDGYIEITTVKTADRLVIELNNHSRAILDKYKDVEFEGHKALPVISNQKMNNYLKELGELAEINEPVSETYYKGSERIDTITPKYALLGTHAGRRTFICNALALGIPAQVVMKWTGHSDYKAMKPYIDIADDVKANAMSKFNQL